MPKPNRSLSVGTKAWAERINGAFRSSMESWFETGRLLIDAKAALPHGDYERMAESELDCSAATARKLAAIAGNRILSDRSNWNALPKHWVTLYDLARIDENTLSALLSDGTIHPKMERSDVPRLLPKPRRPVTIDHEPADQPAPALEHETGGDAAVEDEQQAPSFEDTPGTPPPGVADPHIIDTTGSAANREGDRPTQDAPGAYARERAEAVAGNVSSQSVEDRAREYLSALIEAPGAAAPDLIGVCMQIGRMVTELHAKLSEQQFTGETRYIVPRHYATPNGMVAVSVRPGDRQAAAEAGIAFLGYAFAEGDPEDRLMGAEAAANWTADKPLLSDHVTRICDEMIGFEAKFRSKHGVGNPAALAEGEAA